MISDYALIFTLFFFFFQAFCATFNFCLSTALDFQSRLLSILRLTKKNNSVFVSDVTIRVMATTQLKHVITPGCKLWTGCCRQSRLGGKQYPRNRSELREMVLLCNWISNFITVTILYTHFNVLISAGFTETEIRQEIDLEP